LVILHDVGYAKVPKGSNPFNLDIRKFHSVEGAKIAGRILKSLNYKPDKIKEVKRLVLKHDNWAFGDDFSDEPMLMCFHNFDFMWMASENGFDIVRKFMKQGPKKFYKQIEKFHATEGMKWYSKKVERFYEKLMKKLSVKINLC